MGDIQSFLYSSSHSGFRHGNFQLIHHSTEQITVLSQIDDCGSGSQDTDTVLFQICSQVQRSLSAELSDNAYRLFLLVDTQNIFQSQRLEIQFIGGIVVSRYGLRVTVDNNSFEAELLQCQRSVYAAVVEFDTLSDTVRTAAQNHDLRLVGIHRILVCCVIGGVVVSTVLGTAYMNTFPGFFYTERDTMFSDLSFRNL